MNYIRNLLLSVFIGVLMGLSIPSIADDTDLYGGQSIAITEPVRPNILFMLDSSGSMGYEIRNSDGSPSGIKRIEVLKEALLETLKNINNVNIGLGRFTHYPTKKNSSGYKVDKTNAPILYPVSFINANVDEIETTTGIISIPTATQVMNSTDDATEILTTKAIILDSPDLAMVKLPEEPKGVKVLKRIAAQADDATEYLEDGNKVTAKTYGTGKPIYLGTVPDKGATLVGLRFTDLGIPQGATIEKADISFLSNDAYEDPLDLVITGSGMPATDKSGAVFAETTAYLSNTTNFPTGIASGETDEEGNPVITPFKTVKWSVKSTAASEIFTTPDIKSVIQEMVDRETWNFTNSMVFMFARDSETGTTGTRGFFAYDESSVEAAELRIYWSISGTATVKLEESNSFILETTDGNTRTNFVRLGNDTITSTKGQTLVGLNFPIPVPKGAKITDAKITFTHQGSKDVLTTGSKPLDLLIYAENSNDPYKFGDLSAPDPAVSWKGTKLSVRNKFDPPVKWSNVGKPSSTFPTTAPSEPPIEHFSTPNLKELLQKFIDNQETWKSGNRMVFIFQSDPDSANTATASFRRIVVPKEKQSTATDNAYAQTWIPITDETIPTLEVTYSAGTDENSNAGNQINRQLVGLRFTDVDVPQGAKVLSARIDFVSGEASVDAANLIIQAEDVDNAVEYTDELGNLSGRKSLTSKVYWDSVRPWTTQNAVYSSPDLTEIVQKVVNRSGWCGGNNAMSFIISSDDNESLRNAKSFDEEPGKAPILNVEYDMNQINGNGCINQTFYSQVSSKYDDVEEMTSSDGTIYITSSNLELATNSQATRTVGFRFPSVPLDRGAQIMEANLIFTATKTDTEKVAPANLKLWGQLSLQASEFEGGDGTEFSISSTTKRPRTKATVNWNITEPWVQNRRYQSVNIAPIIQEILEQDEWRSYNPMAFYLTGTGLRNAASFEVNPTQAAVLRIKVAGSLGDAGNMIVRTRLEHIVKNLVSGSFTPIVDALYESTQYYRGGAVEYGKDRYTRSTHFLSHPSTYTGSSIKVDGPSLPYTCPDDKPSAKNCVDEKIVGSASYVSPMESACQESHIVFLTDGAATKNTAAAAVKSLIGGSCAKNYADGEAISTMEECGIELAKFMQSQDHNAKLTGTQKIFLHTVGFQLGKDWITRYKTKDGRIVGKMGNAYYYDYEEQDPQQEANIEDVITTDPVYVENEAGTKRNAKALRFLNELASNGGGKFYEANADDPTAAAKQLEAAFTSIVAQAIINSGSFAAPSVSISASNKLYHNDEIYFTSFKPSKYQRWHGNIKKYRLCGDDNCGTGTGDIVDAKNESVVTAEGGFREDSTSIWSTEPDGGQVDKGGAGDQIPSYQSRNIYINLAEPNDITSKKNLVSAYKTVDPNEPYDIKEELGDAEMSDRELEKLLDWIRGADIDGSERWKFADPLHSSPGVISYAKGDAKLFVGTNDGLIRMIDAETGDEDWAFLPKELLGIQDKLRENIEGPRIYGIDSTPTFWINDINGNGYVEAKEGDFVKMYIGMRRGGRNYYALDITDPSKPMLMFTIIGGEGGFEKLGQTWSQARLVPTNVVCRNPACIVLMFGGGYDELQDESYNKDAVTMGNAIYMADPNSGKYLWSAGASNNDKASLKLAGMDYPIPSNLAFMDSNSDKKVDRIYVGDVHGQVWRIDLEAGYRGIGGRLAVLSEDSKRRFFYSPEIVNIKDTVYAVEGETEYTMVTIVSGTRPDPLGTTVKDQFYALRDLETDKLIAEGNSGNAVQSNGSNETKFMTLTQADLTNITENLIQGSESDKAVAIDNLQNSKGWYLDLLEAGEKGLASPTILKGRVFFTTFIPPAQVVNADTCSMNQGTSRFYSLDLLTGGAGFNLDKIGDESELTTSDRFFTMPGLVSDLVPVFAKDGSIMLPGNNSELPKETKDLGMKWGTLEPTFWMQE